MTIWHAYTPADRRRQRLPADRHWSDMDPDIRMKRLRFRAWHRGTREADLMVGGFFDARAHEWNAEQLDWFEELLEEQDVDIMGWAIGSIPCPPEWDGEMMQQMRALDFVKVPE
jgi:antitoxin CptB